MSQFVAAPTVVLDKEQTLALLKIPAESDAFMNIGGMGKWSVKSTWLCELLDAREATGKYQYNAEFQHWFEKEYGVGPFDENGSPLSLLVYNAQRFRRHDKMIREGYQPGSEELLREAFAKKVDIELYHEPLFQIVVNGQSQDEPNVNRLKVREIGGKLYAMHPRKRKWAVNIIGKPIRLAKSGRKA